MSTKLSDVAANAQANALATLANSGYLRIYAGSKPADPNTALSGQTKLAELRFASTAFQSASAGLIIANSITPETDAPASGTATWFRVFKTDGTTGLWDGTVGASGTGADMTINSTSIVQHAALSISDFRHQVQ